LGKLRVIKNDIVYAKFWLVSICMGMGLSILSLVDLHFFCHFEYIQTLFWECIYPSYLKHVASIYTCNPQEFL